MWLVFAILTVLLWGTSDVIFKNCSDEDDRSVLKLLAYNGIVLGACSIAYGLIIRAEYTWQDLLRYLPIASGYIISMAFYYKMLPLIKLSLGSPIANSSCALTTLLCVFVLKQNVEWWQAIAIILIVAGIVLISIEKNDGQSKKERSRGAYILGILFAMMYFAFDGVCSFCDDYILEGMSEEGVLISYGITYMTVGFVCYLVLKIKNKSYRLHTDKKKLIGSLIETGGQFTYIYALASGDGAIASPFIAAFSVVSIILSRIFLKEKLKLKQYIIVTMLFIGMILLSLE